MFIQTIVEVVPSGVRGNERLHNPGGKYITDFLWPMTRPGKNLINPALLANTRQTQLLHKRPKAL